MQPLVKWTEAGEPFLQLKDGFRMTPLYSDDVDDWLAVKNDLVALAINVHQVKELTREEAAEQVHSQMERNNPSIVDLRAGKRSKWAPFVAIRSPEDKVIGLCGFSNPFEPPPAITGLIRAEFAHLNFGYSILEGYSRKGITTNAAQAMVQYAREHMLSETIAAGALSSNPASVAVLRKVGFQQVYTYDNAHKTASGTVSGMWYTLKLR